MGPLRKPPSSAARHDADPSCLPSPDPASSARQLSLTRPSRQTEKRNPLHSDLCAKTVSVGMHIGCPRGGGPKKVDRWNKIS